MVQWVTRTSETTEDSKGDVLHRVVDTESVTSIELWWDSCGLMIVIGEGLRKLSLIIDSLIIILHIL